MSDEIISGLRNALERGESIDRAARSFLNAGYNPNEVKESVNAITQGATDITIQPAPQHTTQIQNFPQNSPQNVPVAPASPIEVVQKPKKKHTALIIALVSILLIVGGVLVSIVLLGEKILSAMSGFLK